MNIDQRKYFQHNLRLFCEWTDVPCISRNTEDFLVKLLEKHKPAHVLEIWSACGYSLLIIGLTISKRWGTVIGCERAYPNRVEIQKLLALYKSYGMHNLDCLYWPFLALHPDQFQTQTKVFDLVFIDAQKSEYPAYMDYLIQHQLIDDKTILLFDDVIKYQDKIIWLQESLKALWYHYDIHQLDSDDGVLVARK